MGKYSQVRGSFIRGYAEKHREYVKNGWAMITKRDNEHRDLNRAFGFIDPDGTVSVGCKSHIDVEYKRKYDEIESRFRGPYDRNLPNLYDWCKQDGMTIFEYMFIDNLYDEHLEAIAAESVKKEDWQIDYMARKAGLYVQRLKAAHSVGEIKRLITMEVQQHGYAVTRCRKMLKIKPWELIKQKALVDHRHQWKAALERTFDNLIAR